MSKQPCIYFMANRRNGTLYAGVTSNLPARAFQHREDTGADFTRRYDCKLLVYYEIHQTMVEAITREKQIKAGSRAKKIALIEALNPAWRDLSKIWPEALSSLRGGAADAAIQES